MELKMEHISKKFKDKTAVDDVSLTLTTGVWGCWVQTERERPPSCV